MACSRLKPEAVGRFKVLLFQRKHLANLSIIVNEIHYRFKRQVSTYMYVILSKVEGCASYRLHNNFKILSTSVSSVI